MPGPLDGGLAGLLAASAATRGRDLLLELLKLGSLLDNLLGSLLDSLLLLLLDDVVQFVLILVVNEMATRSIGAESDSVEGTAQFGFVLGMAIQVSQFVLSVSKLTLIPVFTMSTLFKGAAHLGLVARRVDVAVLGGAVAVWDWGRLRERAVKLPMLLLCGHLLLQAVE